MILKVFIIHSKKMSDMFKRFFLPACMLLLMNACNFAPPANNKKSDASPANMSRVYDAIILKRSRTEKEISLPSELAPFDAAKIFSKVSGFIKIRKVDIGSIVKKGQVLAMIEAPELKSQLDEAYAKVEAAKAKYQMNKDTYERMNESATTPGVISPNELQLSKRQMISDSALYASARYHFHSIQDLNNYLIITSPFNGVITARNADVGDIVGPNSPKPMFEIEMNSILRLRVPVPESLTGDELASKDIKFSVPAYPGQLFPARFARKSNSLDIDTRSEIWEFDADNAGNALKPGMYADAEFELSRKEGTFVVPKPAVITSLEKNFVILIHQDTVQLVSVSNGMYVKDSIEIFGNLHEGDTMLVNGSEEMKDGMKVDFKISGK